MKANESTGEYAPDRQESTERQIDDDPDHDVPVAEQLTERQLKLVGRDGGDGR
jgi:hypothetical protein